jgi:hypothetical protein
MQAQLFMRSSEWTLAPSLKGKQWKWETCLSRPKIVDRFPTMAKVPKDHHKVVVITYLENGRSAASMLLVD